MTCKQLVKLIQDNHIDDYEFCIPGYLDQKIQTVEFNESVQEKLRKLNKLYLFTEKKG
jgi:hypothetical protein